MSMAKPLYVIITLMVNMIYLLSYVHGQAINVIIILMVCMRFLLIFVHS